MTTSLFLLRKNHKCPPVLKLNLLHRRITHLPNLMAPMTAVMMMMMILTQLTELLPKLMTSWLLSTRHKNLPLWPLAKQVYLMFPLLPECKLEGTDLFRILSLTLCIQEKHSNLYWSTETWSGV